MMKQKFDVVAFLQWRELRIDKNLILFLSHLTFCKLFMPFSCSNLSLMFYFTLLPVRSEGCFPQSLDSRSSREEVRRNNRQN